MFLHASRSQEYRTPFGARPTDGKVTLYFDTPVDAESITLCYTYGLYGFSYHEEPMCLTETMRDHKRYSVSILMRLRLLLQMLFLLVQVQAAREQSGISA